MKTLTKFLNENSKENYSPVYIEIQKRAFNEIKNIDTALALDALIVAAREAKMIDAVKWHSDLERHISSAKMNYPSISQKTFSPSVYRMLVTRFKNMIEQNIIGLRMMNLFMVLKGFQKKIKIDGNTQAEKELSILIKKMDGLISSL